MLGKNDKTLKLLEQRICGLEGHDWDYEIDSSWITGHKKVCLECGAEEWIHYEDFLQGRADRAYATHCKYIELLNEHLDRCC